MEECAAFRRIRLDRVPLIAPASRGRCTEAARSLNCNAQTLSTHQRQDQDGSGLFTGDIANPIITPVGVPGSDVQQWRRRCVDSLRLDPRARSPTRRPRQRPLIGETGGTLDEN
jgi:hypothetical protein